MKIGQTLKNKPICAGKIVIRLNYCFASTQNIINVLNVKRDNNNGLNVRMRCFLVDENHLAILKKGVEAWNKWRKENPSIKPDLSGANLRLDLRRANLSNANLNRADFFRAYLCKANLSKAYLNVAYLSKANLTKANLSGAILRRAYLYKANLRGANLSSAKIRGADLSGADLREANLSMADISGTRMIGVRLNGAILTDCRIFGVSAWDLKGLEEAEQKNLVITPEDASVITVDNLEVAQFIYILLYNEKIRSVIDSITSKVVLILGRFTPERKAILDAIREELRKRNYLPVLFDFDKPASRNITETVTTLAHMARFIIADITDAKSIPQELMAIVPFSPSVPVQPILLSTEEEYGMFESFGPFPWVLEIHRYNDQDELLRTLGEKVIAPAENKAKEIQKK